MANGSVTVVQESRANDAVAVSSQLFTLATDFNAVLAPTTPGTTLIVYVSCITKTRVLQSITDSASNSGWKVIGGAGSSSGGNLYMAVLPAANHVNSITTITVNTDLTTKVQVVFREVKGITGVISNGGTAFAFDDHTTAATTGASSATMTADGGAPKWVVAAAAAVTIPTSVAAPFTTDAAINGGGQGIQVFSGDSSLQLGSGSITATFTQTSEVSTTGIVAFDVFQDVEIPYKGLFPIDGRTGADGPWTGPLHMFVEYKDIITTAAAVAYTDAATATLTLDCSGSVETAQFVDSATAVLTNDASTSLESAQFVDANTCFLSNVTSGTETSQFVDADTAFLTTAVYFIEDFGQASTDVRTSYPYTLMPGPYEGPFSKFGEEHAIQRSLFYSAENEPLGNPVAVGDGGLGDDYITMTSIGSPSTSTYDNTHVSFGSQNIKAFIPNGSAQSASIGFNAETNGENVQAFLRFYIYLEAYPSQNTQIGRFLGASGFNLVSGVRLNTTGTLTPVRAGNTAVGSSSGTVPLNQLVRIELQVIPDANGVVSLMRTKAWWTDPHSNGTPDYDQQNSAIVTGDSVVTGAAWGVTTNPTAFTADWSIWLDGLGFSWGGWLGALVGASTTFTYTDADTASLTLVASDVQEFDGVDSATGQLTLVGSAGDTAQFVDSITCTLSLVASATEVAVFVDSFTCTLTNVASGTDVPIYTEASTGVLSLVASDSQLFAGVDQDTAFLVSVAGGGELIPSPYDIPFGGVFPLTSKPGPFLGPVGLFKEERITYQYVDEGVVTCTLLLVASAVETAQFVDAAQCSLSLVASAPETAQFVDAFTPTLTLDCSASTEAYAALYPDAATCTLQLVAGGSEGKFVSTLFVDDEFNRTLTNALGTAFPQGGTYVLATGVSATKYSVNGTRAVINADNTTQRSAILPVAQADTDSQITFAFAALPATHIFRVGLYARESFDGANFSYYSPRVHLDASGNVKLRIEKEVIGTTINLVPEATILTGYTGGTDIKLRFVVTGTTLQAKIWYATDTEPTSWTQQVTDTDITGAGNNGFYANANTGLEGTTVSFESYTVQGPGTDTGITYFDADTATLSLVAAGAQVFAAVDAATVPLSLVAGGVDAIGDFGTATLTLDASTSVEAYYVDTFTTQFLLTAGGTESYSYHDAATALLTTVASATFVRAFNDDVTCFLTTFAFDLLPKTQFVDSSICVLLLVAQDLTETQPIYDYFLATTLNVRWTTVAIGFRLSSSLSGRFTTDVSDRFDTHGVGFDPRG